MKLIQLVLGQSNLLSKNQFLLKSITNTNKYDQIIKSKYLASKIAYSTTNDNKQPVKSTQTQLEQQQLKLKEEKEQKQAKIISLQNTTIVDSFPTQIQPYLRLMRLDKPIGTLVVFWPGAWSIIAAASYLNQTIPDLQMLGIFALGAFTMRSAGCIINDIWDHKFDRQVERTKTRPIASGQIGIPSALLLLATNLGISTYLLLQLNLVTQILGACALFPTVIYPSAKRFTNWPQLYLGFAINWAALMGWTAVLCNDISNISNIFQLVPGLALYTSCISWTIFYDTIYAHQDKNDDQKLGLKSTTFTFGNKPKLWLLGFSTLATSNLCLFGYLTNQQPIFYGFMALVYAHFLKQILFVNLNSTESCHKHFRSNNTIGWLTALGLTCSLFAR